MLLFVLVLVIVHVWLVVHVTCMSSCCCCCSSPNSVSLGWGHRMIMGWMDVTVVGVCLGLLRCSCGVLNFPFDGKVGWWLLALECVMCVLSHMCGHGCGAVGLAWGGCMSRWWVCGWVGCV